MIQNADKESSGVGNLALDNEQGYDQAPDSLAGASTLI